MRHKPKVKTVPTRLTDPGFVWYDAWHTDVQRTWRRFGWKTKAERDAEKKK